MDLSPSFLMVILVFFQLVLMFWQNKIVNGQKRISECILDLQRRIYLPVIVPRAGGVTDRAFGYPLHLKNVSSMPALDLVVEAEGSPPILLDKLDPGEDRGVTLSRRALEHALNGELEIRLRFLDPAGQAWLLTAKTRKGKPTRLQISPPRLIEE